MSRAGALWAGVHAAVGAPWALRDAALAALVAEPEGAARAPVAGGADVRADARQVETSVGVALRVLAWLSRVPRGPWRNTCLFRAAAECRAMRAAGLPAVVRIGVAREDAERGASITAHAWVECAGVRCRTAQGEERGTWAVLHPTG